jgi:hypothetical protein
MRSMLASPMTLALPPRAAGHVAERALRSRHILIREDHIE